MNGLSPEVRYRLCLIQTTLASAAALANADSRVEQVLIITADKDLGQCVRGTRVVQFDRRKNEIIDEDAVTAKFGVPPSSIADYLALVGDSADGYPGIAGWVVVPIASHTLSNRPIVLPDTGEVRIGIVAGKDVSANFDMHNVASLMVGDQVRVRRSAHKVRFLHPRGWSYYATLRRKLRWHEGVV